MNIFRATDMSRAEYDDDSRPKRHARSVDDLDDIEHLTKNHALIDESDNIVTFTSKSEFVDAKRVPNASLKFLFTQSSTKIISGSNWMESQPVRLFYRPRCVCTSEDIATHTIHIVNR